MKSLGFSAQKNRLLVATLALLVVSLVIPQLAWADHASDHPESQFDILPGPSAQEEYTALVEKYRTGELVYNAPGRRDDRSFAASANEAYAALVEKYRTGELVYNAPGRRDDRSFSDSVNSDRIDTAFLAANPEIGVYQRYLSVQQEIAAAASSARWVALGSYYAAAGANFLAANPEIGVYQRYLSVQQEIAAAASSARWVALGSYYAAAGAPFLAANPEIMPFRRYSQDKCSALEQVC